MITRLKDRITARIKSALAGAISWAGVNWSSDVISALGGGGRGRGPEAWLKAFRENAQVRGPVDRVATDTAAVRIHLRRRLAGAVGLNGKPPSEEIYDQTASEIEARVLRLVKQPNPGMTGSKFRHLCEVWLEMCGFAPCLIEWEEIPITQRRRLKVPKNLWPIAPHRLVSLPSADKPYFVFLGGRGRRVQVDPGDVFWRNRLDVLEPYGPGCGAAMAVDDEVSQIHYAGLWNNNFYRQGAHPGALVALDGASETTKKSIQANWDSKHVGIHNAHRTLFVEGKVDVKMLSGSHKEQDFVATMQHLGDRIRFNWRVPPELLGDVRNSNRATAQAAEYIHQSGNLTGRVCSLEEDWNLYLVPLFGQNDLYLEWDNPVRQTEELVHQRLTDGYTVGTVTRDEWRMGSGMDPRGGALGPCYSVPLNMQQVPENGPVPVSPDAAQMEAVKRVYDAAEALVRGDQSRGRGSQARNGSGLHSLS